MIRCVFGACVLLCLTLPAGAQVIGHTPEQSPYIDASGRHHVSLLLGWLNGGGDPAGVGPTSGPMVLGRYEYDIDGPLTTTLRLGYAPTLTRHVKDPMFSGPLRDLGTAREPLLMLDGGIQLSLTGDKTYRGIQPRLHGNLGLITSLQREFDLGEYRFGPKFTLAYGASARILSKGPFEYHVDLTHAFWRMNYPPLYGDNPSVQEPSIIGGSRTNPWVGNVILSFGVSRVWGR